MRFLWLAASFRAQRTMTDPITATANSARTTIPRTTVPTLVTATTLASSNSSTTSSIPISTTANISTSTRVNEQSIAVETSSNDPENNFGQPEVPIINTPTTPTNGTGNTKQNGIANASQAIIFSILVVGVCLILAALGIAGFKIYSKNVLIIN